MAAPRLEAWKQDVAARGPVGILVPPSLVLAVYAWLSEQDGDHPLLHGILPGLLALGMSTATVCFLCRGMSPVAGPTDDGERSDGIGLVALLFLAVIGGISTGVRTPTKTAAAGACAEGAPWRCARPARCRGDPQGLDRSAQHLGRHRLPPDRRHPVRPFSRCALQNVAVFLAELDLGPWGMLRLLALCPDFVPFLLETMR